MATDDLLDRALNVIVDALKRGQWGLVQGDLGQMSADLAAFARAEIARELEALAAILGAGTANTVLRDRAAALREGE